MAYIGRFLVDDSMYEELNQYIWKKNKDGYAVDYNNIITMHRLILGAKEGEIVDHINGKPWDNRRENLRIVTATQSNTNRRRVNGGTSKYKGVYQSKVKAGDKVYTYWYAKVKKHGIETKKRFQTELDAAKGYDEMAKETHGDYARLNFPNM